MLHGIALGDLHLDKLRKHFPENSIELQLNEVRKVVRYAKRNGIKRLFFLGDIGEGVKNFTGFLVMSEEAQAGLFSLLMELDGEFEVFIYIGNHDYTGLESHTLKFFFELQKHKVFKTVRFFDQEEQLKLGGVRVNILPYPLLKPSSNKPSLCFAHYEVKGSIRDNGRRIDEGEEHDYGAHSFIQGHLHTRQVVRKQHWYPGTLYQTTFGESLPKGFLEFRASQESNKVVLKSRFVDNDPSFKLINLHIHERDDLKKIEPNPLYKYKLFVAEDVRIRDSDLDKHENIVNRLAFGSKEELAALEYSEFMLESTTIDLTYDKALDTYLRKTKGLTRKEVERCKVLLEKRIAA